MSHGDEEIVITYRLRRDELPPLFANLAPIPKGPPRVARLKALVTQGFAAEQKIVGLSDESAIRSPAQTEERRSVMDDLLDGKTEQGEPAGPMSCGGGWR